MRELIDRDAALSRFHDYIDKRGDIYPAADCPEYRAIEALPAVPGPEWIPCDERMPNKDDICLICGKNGGIYVARFWRNETLTLWTKTGTGKHVRAIAWMPLPEPYKED